MLGLLGNQLGLWNSEPSSLPAWSRCGCGHGHGLPESCCLSSPLPLCLVEGIHETGGERKAKGEFIPGAPKAS